MKVIEHRRHSIRVTPGAHLSQQGVDLARRVGEEIGRVDLVITSPVPRAFETAIAMGFAVHRQEKILAEAPKELGDAWESGFPGIAPLLRTSASQAMANYRQQLVDLTHAIAAELPERGRALIVSHGGIVEAWAMSAVEAFDFSSWGENLSYCEGIRISFDGSRFLDPELLRVT